MHFCTIHTSAHAPSGHQLGAFSLSSSPQILCVGTLISSPLYIYRACRVGGLCSPVIAYWQDGLSSSVLISPPYEIMIVSGCAPECEQTVQRLRCDAGVSEAVNSSHPALHVRKTPPCSRHAFATLSHPPILQQHKPCCRA